MKSGEIEAQMGPMDWRRAEVPGFQGPFLTMMEHFPKQLPLVLGAAVPSGYHRLCPALDLAHPV